MHSQSTLTQIRLNDIEAGLAAAAETVGILSNSFKTPFLLSISSTIQSLLELVQSNPVGELPPSMLYYIGDFVATLHKIHTFVEQQQDGSLIKKVFRQGEINTLLKDCRVGLQHAVDTLKHPELQSWEQEEWARQLLQELFYITQTSYPNTKNIASLSPASLLQPTQNLLIPRCLLILDNLETVWEPTVSREDIEQFLSDIKHVTLIITMRGAERPAQVRWTRPFLPPLQPLTQDAARMLFMDIADDRHDVNEIDQALLLTDNMPLAIDLVANLVDSYGYSTILSQWETQKTVLCSEGLDRRSNLDLSISLSLSSPRFTSVPYAKELLSQKRLKVLFPIREHIQKYHGPTIEIVDPLFHGYQKPLNLDTIYCGVNLNSFTRLSGRGSSPFMAQIPLLLPQLADYQLEVYFMTEYISSDIVPNSDAMVERAYEYMHCFDDFDVKFQFYNAVGHYYLNRSNITAAIDSFQRGLSVSTSARNTPSQSVALKNLAWIKSLLGDHAAGQRVAKHGANLYNEGMALYIEACEKARSLLTLCGMSGGTVDNEILSVLAEIHRLKSEYSQSRAIHTKILEKHNIQQKRFFHASVLLNIAEIDVAMGAPMEDVLRNISIARPIMESMGRTRENMLCDIIQADLCLREGEMAAAQKLLKKCLKSSFGKSNEVTTYCLEFFGNVYRWSEMYWSSTWPVLLLVHALKSKQKLNINKGLQYLGDFNYAEGEQKTAINLYTVALEGFTEMDVHQSKAECMIQIGEISKENGNFKEADGYWKAARRLFECSSQGKKVSSIDGRLSAINDYVQENAFC
ncbi:hypothetical protein GGX14DRAFT_405990 [Mycena pura]|uniref:TPR-like protein n=1 Tax=Mycena pura TaxID=153505 RepID=A0AAD6URB8_9AGAR|nr:hypothetical protein GGX14DRAFT_405990 [Mycena pura]